MSTISTSVTITQTNITNNTYNWPITISGGTSASPITITIGSDLTLNTSASTKYFIIASNYITINGSNNTIFIGNVTNYPGLIRNGTSTTASTKFSYINVKNINVVADTITPILLTYGGWICQRYWGNTTCTVDNCSSSIAFNTNTSGGGILGSQSSAIVTNCYSSGAIGSYGGGIFGYACSGTATNCYSTGNTGIDSGGIFGNATTSGTAINCYSTGNLGSGAGGIFGRASTGTATDCHSTGTIGTSGGGIFGYGCNGTATNCYSTGNMIGAGCGGIFGIITNQASIANNCYSTGNSTADGCGGIFGRSGSGTAIDCYSTGNTSNNCGGIFGRDTLSTAVATNCFSSGSIGSAGGGIFGVVSNGTATNCYSTGIINYRSGGIFGRQGSGTATNCYATGNMVEFSDGGGGIFGIISSGTANYCHYTGIISGQSGGIFAKWATSTSRANSCYSTGSIGIQSGGIFGYLSAGIATDCYSTGTINYRGGGIFGRNATGTATNCYATGNMVESAEGSGGIFGIIGSGIANNCHYTGTITSHGGGIFAKWATSTSRANNCYSTGSIGYQGGGIFGYLGAGIATDCYSTGTIDYRGGGIFGREGSGTATNCYASGNMLESLEGSGGIFGIKGSGTANNCNYTGTISTFGGGIFSSWSTSTANANNCYTTGTIGISGGGIFGYWCYGNATNCYSTGVINDLAGGIFGAESFGTATNCYANGNMAENVTNGCGGIFGQNSSGTATSCHYTGTITNSGGGIFALSAKVISTANNCYSSGSIGTEGGGIFGRLSYGTASNCYSTGVINDLGGGIFGQQCYGNATNCYATGNMSENVTNGCGGIFGHNSSGTATSCYYTGTITNSGGGIFALSAKIYSNAINCYSNGSIGTDGGGIFGKLSYGTATNCYSTGTIGTQAGGIFGLQSYGTATACYSTGVINDLGGGIFGQKSYGLANYCAAIGNMAENVTNGCGGIFGHNSSGTATNCYYTGTISDYGGGIFALSAIQPARAINCYTTGTIGTNGGGIFGKLSSGTAINCYSSGNISNISHGIFGPSYVLPITNTNCYVANGAWSNYDAVSALQSGTTPTDNNPSGTVWSDIDTTTQQPFVLTTMRYSPYTNSNENTYNYSISPANNTPIQAIDIVNNSFSLISINNEHPSNYSNISFNSTTGAISVNNISDVMTYEIKVYQTKNGIYSSSHFTLVVLNYNIVNIYLNELDTTIMPYVNLAWDSTQHLITDYDATATIYVKTTDMKNIFNFGLDSTDVADINETDIIYYLNYDDNKSCALFNKSVFSSMLTSNGIGGTMDINGNDLQPDDIQIPQDYARHISTSLFGIPYLVDIFNNEGEFCSDLYSQANLEINNKHNALFKAIDSANANNYITQNGYSGIDTTTNIYSDMGNKHYVTNSWDDPKNIGKQIFNQILNADPNRFTTELNNSNIVKVVTNPENKTIFKMPFMDGDTLAFKVTINPNMTQVTELIPFAVDLNIPQRTYKIEYKLVSDIDYNSSQSILNFSGLNNQIDSSRYTNMSAITSYSSLIPVV